MQEQFFTHLESLLNDSTDLTLKISKTTDGLLVLIQPKSNRQQNNTIPPLTIKGTAEELDKAFFRLIQTPLEKATGIITNINWHTKTLSEVQKKQQKKKTTPLKTPKPTEITTNKDKLTTTGSLSLF